MSLPRVPASDSALRARIDTNTTLAQGIVQRAARCAPGPLAARLEEEWLADLAARRGGLARLRLAFGCWWAARVITREHAALGLAAVAGTADSHALTEGRPLDFSFVSARTLAIIVIACLHLAVLCTLARSLTQPQPQRTDSTQATFVPEVDSRLQPPPPLGSPSLADVRVRRADARPLLPPLVNDPPTADSSSPPLAGDPSPPLPPRTVTRVIGGIGAGFPSTIDFYPLAARRMGEAGAATIQVCVDASGYLSAAPFIATSSGSARLDDWALRLVRAGSGHFRPTTEDGRPVNFCYPFRVRFELRR
jgi:TonB family protein